MAERYVVQGAVGGDGSIGLPWGTLDEAETNAVANDNINVAAGTYPENGGLSSVVTNKLLTWVATGEVIVQSVSTSWVLICQTSGLKTWTGFTFDGQGAASDGVIRCNTAGNDLSIIDTVVTGIDSAGSLYSSEDATTDGVTFDNVTVDGVSSDRIFNFNNNSNVTVINSQMDGTWSLITNTNNANGFTFNANTVNIASSGGGGTPMAITGNATVTDIKDNNFTLTGNFLRGVFLHNCVNPVITGNTIDSRGVTDPNATILEVRASVAGAYNPAVVTDNIVFGSGTNSKMILVGTDIPSAGDNELDGAIIKRNYVESTTSTNGGAHPIEMGYNIGTVEHNRVKNAPFGYIMKGEDDYALANGCNFNIAINCTNSSSIRIKGPQNIPVRNNTLYVDDLTTAGNALVHININTESANLPSTGTRLQNTIITTSSGNGGHIISVDTASSPSFEAGGNLIWAPNRTLTFALNGTTQSGLVDWNTETGFTDFEGDPLFVDAPNGNFELQAGSAALGIGIKYWGNGPRPTSENGEPLPDTGIDAGANQSKLHPSHPANPNFVPL